MLAGASAGILRAAYFSDPLHRDLAGLSVSGTIMAGDR
jgi:hypothetical protein